MTGRRAIVLLSGGLDSATTLAIARAEGFACSALSVHYGQRHRVELESARRVAQALGVREHIVVPLDLRRFGGSVLTADGEVPKDRDPEATESIPVTYVPARNTIFLSLALAWAEVLEVDDLFIGVNAVDYSGYPDCRPAFIEAFERVANVATARATEGGHRVTIHAPLLHKTKAEIIRWGTELGVDYGLTVSCYDPSDTGRVCGRCDACRLRQRGFDEAGLPDPALEARSAREAR